MRKLLALAVVIIVAYGCSNSLSTTNRYGQAPDDLTGFLHEVAQMSVDGIRGMAQTIAAQSSAAPRKSGMILTESDIRKPGQGQPAQPNCQVPIADTETEILRLINQERTSVGLALLSLDSGLAAGARSRSEDQVKRGYYSHDDPVTGKSLMEDFGAKGEIIAGIYIVCPASQGAQQVVARWMDSAPHRAIMLAPYMTRGGAGIAIRSDGVMIATALFAY